MGKSDTKKALTIGILCITTYLANYYLRHILSVMTPKLIELGEFTLDHIGLLSSAYMLLYAVGQLVNGFLGDILSPKKMVLDGVAYLSAAGANLLFASFMKNAGWNVVLIMWACIGIIGLLTTVIFRASDKKEPTETNE